MNRPDDLQRSRQAGGCFLVSFRVRRAAEWLAGRATVRVQTADAAGQSCLEALSSRDSALEWSSRRLSAVEPAGGARALADSRTVDTVTVSFEATGSFESLDRAFGLSGASRGAAQPPSSALEAELRRAAAGAFGNWRRSRYELELPRGRRWTLGERVSILGILNVTPDSFSDGGQYDTPEAAMCRGCEMLEEGADAIDIGGESTRPGSEPVAVEEEIRRVVGVVAELRKRTDAPISVDTSKAEVARLALDSGADIINDVTALEGDADMLPLVAERPAVPLVLMHMQGRPQTMQDEPRYDDARAEIIGYLERRLRALEAAGIDPERLLVDPGFGFGKRSADNLALLDGLDEFRSLGRPVLVGLSRKSFLGRLLGRSVEEREAGTLVANTVAALGGAAVIRTHHIVNAREMVRLLGALGGNRPPDDRPQTAE